MANSDGGKVKKKSDGLRGSLTSYGDAGFSYFLRKSFAKSLGYGDEELERPVVGIANTASGMVSCHGTVPQLVEAVKRGVTAAGGLALEFPTISLGEPFLNPTSMLFRNLMAIDTEEMIRAHPVDSVVLIGGCDKTVPAQLMAAASANVPAILLVTGPMMTGSHRGERLGACTDCRRLWGEHRGGRLNAAEIDEISGRLMPTSGTCMVMGTASTMACITEALGMMLPGGAAIPAVHSDRLRNASESGAQAVRMIENGGPKPRQIITPAALTNAFRVLLAIGGSTNGVIHLAALAGRLGIEIDYGAFDRLGRETPVLLDLKPSGAHYMEDLNKAGGMAPILRELAPLLNLDCLTVTGRSLGEELAAAAPAWPQEVVRAKDNPLHAEGGIAVLNGNLAPDGAIIKHSAATPALLSHEGRAVVFDSLDDLAERIDDPALDVTPDDVLVLRNAGPKGAPGMPEAGYIPIPKKLAEAGVKDMLRISDARMSGTAFGAIVLHLCPEAAVGGPLALVKNGDRVRLDVPARRVDVLVSDQELEARRAAWTPPPPHTGAERGWLAMHLAHVQQADKGCDLDILAGEPSGATAPL
ncbi:MAG: IlvD/Edd family dehydratase [Alphaproteobacteria bacterium]|jgi:dihydroxy-acid dehydratase|nr:IlvD/Edd family dehydratase [Alphaproteobacteria bacterium]